MTQDWPTRKISTAGIEFSTAVMIVVRVILIAVVCWLIILGTATLGYTCDAECNTIIFELRLNNFTIEGYRDMTADECFAAWEEIEPQVPPTATLVCVETPVAREQI